MANNKGQNGKLSTKQPKREAVPRYPGVYRYKSDNRVFQGKPDECYSIRYTMPGGGNKKRLEKIGWKSEGYSPQTAAEVRAERMRAIRHDGEVKTNRELQAERKKQDRTINEIASVYFEERKGKLKGYTTDFNRYENYIQPIFGDRSVSGLSELDIRRIEKEMPKLAEERERKKEDKKRKKVELAPATISNTIELLRRLINYGVKTKMCKRPDFTIQVPKKDNTVTEYLTPDEMTRLNNILDNWESRDVVRMLRLAMFTGMRRGEIFKLEDQDLDFRYNLITIRNPKGEKTVTIPMNVIARELLHEQMIWRDGKHPGSTVIFPGTSGRIRTDCSAAKRIKAKAKLPTKFRIFHGLRHHFAVTLANSGEYSMDEIAELLTHKDPKLTKERYAQFLPERKQALSNRAAELLAGRSVIVKDEVVKTENSRY